LIPAKRRIGPLTEEIKPLRDHIADTVRTLIIEGKMVPGERLREPDLAGQLGVSRTPLREALRLLESEGFVQVLPRRGAVVSPLSVRDATEIYQVKGALESLAARLACAKISPSQLAQLGSINDAIERGPSDHSRILQLNAEFHHVLSDVADNEKLSQYIRLLRRQALRYNYIYLSTLSHLEDSVREHRAILSALAAGDAAGVERCVREHGESACRALCTFIQEPPEPLIGSVL
jgi:DNA-binding GntR family transcriptional regulator